MKLYEVRNDSGRRFHVGEDKDEALEVAIRLEAQLRDVAPAAAVGGATASLVDLPSYVVITVDAPTREAVADAIEVGVPLPGTPVGQLSGNEVDERKAAELRARGTDGRIADALGAPPEGTTLETRTTNLEPRPEPGVALDTAPAPAPDREPDRFDSLTGDELDQATADAEIEGRSSMSADEKRAALRTAEASTATA